MYVFEIFFSRFFFFFCFLEKKNSFPFSSFLFFLLSDFFFVFVRSQRAFPLKRTQRTNLSKTPLPPIRGKWGKTKNQKKVGTYLFTRISADDGKDSRFSTMRYSPPKFFGAFLIQAAWVSTCLMPVLALNAIPASYFALLPASVAATDIIGLALFAGGFGLEIAADRQKSAWLQEKREKKHDEAFLTRGLWGLSRHPNYFGEMMLWTGIAVVAGGVMVRKAGQVGMGFAPLSLLGGGGKANVNANAAISMFRGRALGLLMAGISPAFVMALLLFVSGVPPSEKKYDAKYGERADYQEWKRNTPMLIPKVF